MSLKPTALQVETRRGARDRPAGVRILSLRYYPGAIQAGVLALFLFLIWQAFFGSPHGENNAASAIIWTIWWPLLSVLFFLFARGWCAVCPLGAVSALSQKLFRGMQMTPGDRLRTIGPWFMSVFVFFITVANLIWGLEEFPARTGLFFGALLLASVLTALVYEGRAWCRYLCPIGALSGLLSAFSLVELRPQPKECAGCASKTCRAGTASGSACPLYETPLTLNSNKNCNLCGNCVKTCSGGAFSLRWRNPFSELSRPLVTSQAEFVTIILFIGLTWFEGFRMTQPFRSMMKSLVMVGVAPSYDAALLMVFLIVVAAMGGAYALLTKASGVSWSINTLIPLALVGHLSVGVYHLLMSGPRALAVGVNSLNLPFLMVNLEPVVRNSVYTVDLPVKAIQVAVLLAGAAASIYLCNKLHRSIKEPPAWRMPVWTPLLLIVVLFLTVLSMPVTMMH